MNILQWNERQSSYVVGMFLLLFLTAKVPPEVTLPNTRIGQTLGRDTVLECVIMSSPQALYYWEKDGRRITSSSKHAVDAYDEADHTLVLSLRVRRLTPGDYGTYNCVASNSLGVAQRAMTLYGIRTRDGIEVAHIEVGYIKSLWNSCTFKRS